MEHAKTVGVRSDRRHCRHDDYVVNDDGNRMIVIMMATQFVAFVV
jgi:hypothetical protein